MSLKAFHLVFIIASIALALGFSAWLLVSYHAAGGIWNLVAGIGSALAAVGLVFYERYFLKKFKNVSYL
jgi:hypothetical protein